LEVTSNLFGNGRSCWNRSLSLLRGKNPPLSPWAPHSSKGVSFCASSLFRQSKPRENPQNVPRARTPPRHGHTPFLSQETLPWIKGRRTPLKPLPGPEKWERLSELGCKKGRPPFTSHLWHAAIGAIPFGVQVALLPPLLGSSLGTPPNPSPRVVNFSILRAAPPIKTFQCFAF